MFLQRQFFGWYLFFLAVTVKN